MDTAPLRRSGGAAPALALVLLALPSLAGTTPARGAGTPRLVSPGAPDPGAVAELRCPTFSWAGVEGASRVDGMAKVSENFGRWPAPS